MAAATVAMFDARDLAESFDFGISLDWPGTFKSESDGVDSGVCTPEAGSPGPQLLSFFNDFEHHTAADILTADLSGLTGTLSHFDEVCDQLELADAEHFIGLQLDTSLGFPSLSMLDIPSLTDASPNGLQRLSTASTVLSFNSINPALFSSSKSTIDDEEGDIDIETVEDDNLSTADFDTFSLADITLSTPLALPASLSAFAGLTPLSFATSSAAIATSPADSMMDISTPSTSSAASSRSSTPNKNRAHPYGHTPKRNTERKRQLHNELERKRREDLNSIFTVLGDVVPALNTSSKAAPTQTQILVGASEYLRELKDNAARLHQMRQEALAESARLQARLMLAQS